MPVVCVLFLLLFPCSLSLDHNGTMPQVCDIQPKSSGYPVFRLPVLDLKEYTDPLTRQNVINSFDEYLSNFGTMSITNHEIPLSLIKEVFGKGSGFFSQSNDYKSSFGTNSLGSSGYQPWGSYAGASAYGNPDQPPDLVEDFAMYNHDGTVKWKDFGPSKELCPIELYDVSRKYLKEIKRVSWIIHEIAALALRLDGDYFNKMYHGSPGLHLRWFNYPPLNVSLLLPKQMRVSGHKDYLGFTFLVFEGRGSQMRIGKNFKNGIWIDVETQNPYDLVINTGELFELWTNGHWKPNWHRVIPLPNVKRTLSFFTGPDQDTVIEPIQGCDVCTKEEQKFVTRTAAEQAMLRYSGADLQFDEDGRQFFNDE